MLQTKKQYHLKIVYISGKKANNELCQTTITTLSNIYDINLVVYAVQYGYENVVNFLMKRATPGDSTYLLAPYYAVTKEQFDILSMLITSFDIDVREKDNRLLRQAMEISPEKNQQSNIVNLLIKHGAETRFLEKEDEIAILGDAEQAFKNLTAESVANNINAARNTVDYYMRNCNKNAIDAMVEAPDFLKPIFLEMFNQKQKKST